MYNDIIFLKIICALCEKISVAVEQKIVTPAIAMLGNF